MAKRYEKEYDKVTVSKETIHLTKISLTVPYGFDHNDGFKAMRRLGQSALQQRVKAEFQIIREGYMIKKICLAIGVVFALASSPVISAELDKKAKAEFCKEQAASIIKHIRATVGAWRDYSKATHDYDIARQSKDKKLIATAVTEQNRWREIHKIGLKHLDRYAAIWSAYCK